MPSSISTTEFAWEQRCREFFTAGEAFELCDVQTANHIRFCELFAKHCGYLYEFNGGVASFTPGGTATPPIRTGELSGPPLELIKLRCRVYEREKNWEALHKASLESLAPEAPDPDLLAFIGWAEHKLGRTRKALVFLELCAPAHGDHSEVAYRLACLNCALGKVPLAEECLKRAIANSKDPQKLKQRALLEPELEPLRLTTIIC
jgi:tetratricopeptide (TPR) repeat protein